MKRFLTTILALAMLLGCIGVTAFAEENCPSKGFSDVPPEGNWAHAGIDFMVEKGYMNGVGGDRFSPDGIVTRAQLVTILYRFSGSPDTEFKGTFTDVENGKWYSLPIEWAAANGIVNGVGEGRFNPDGKITREQIAAILYRYSGSPKTEGDLKAFPDAGRVSAYAVDALVWATKEGLINGVASGGVMNLAPGNNATRAQIAAIIWRYSEKHFHKYEAVITAPTCTEKGYTTYTCACGDSYVADETEALGHDYVAGEPVAPSCTEKGYTVYTCSRCGDQVNRDETAALGHDYQSTVTAPTCTEGGYTTYTCSRCGDSYKADETEALGHDWDEGEITKQPTETEQGEHTYTCVRCGEQRAEAIPTLLHVHDYRVVVTAPTCTESGFTTHTCACGESYVDSEVPALGHSFGEWTTGREATCTAAGEQTRACVRCGEKETRAITALGHDYKAVVTTPSCTEKGYTIYTCTRCGDTYTGNEIDALGHDYQSVVTTPTCTEQGYTTYTCSRCGDTYTADETAALGHAYENGVCIRCGEADPDYVDAGTEKPVGYLAAAPFGEGFIACGTGGRIDYISTQGEITRLDSGTKADLRSVYTDYPNILVGGDSGTVLISTDAGESFMPMNASPEADLYGAVEYRGVLYCAGSGGSIYRMDSNGWKKVRLSTTNDVISLIITKKYLVAVTAETDVFYSENGSKWVETNFNEEYHGLYPEYVFTRAVGAGDTFFVLGYEKENPNIPLIMYTESGEVWLQLMLAIINGEYVTGEEELRIHDICFNVDQIVGVMDDGRILAITDCFKCNEEKQLEQTYDLWATAIQEDGVLVCGEDFFCRVLGRNQIRQDKIAEEQAYYDVQNGALLIDVRTAGERAGGYVKGSVHIPLAQLAEKMPEIAPDPYTEIIFYCASGKRAQTATEQALDMGYKKVYNLGGLSDIAEGYFEIVKE